MDANKLKSKLHYDSDTGIFTWIESSKGTKAGAVAGSKCGKYTIIIFNQARYLAHRLAWLYVYGEMPKNFIDHVNGNGMDNRICNLREATKNQNCHNSKISKRNTSGVKGVSWHKYKQKWHARLNANHKSIHIGYFDDLELAELVMNEARLKYHGNFARSI